LVKELWSGEIYCDLMAKEIKDYILEQKNRKNKKQHIGHKQQVEEQCLY
jgi:hypothetical protein